MKQLIALAVLASLPLGCVSITHHENRSHSEGNVDLARLTSAVAVIAPTGGNTAHGTVTFEQTAAGVRVTADISGLSPNGIHAWHIHEFGDVRAGDGTATGGHYNPEGHPHGLPDQPDRHAGDFGNLEADGSGRASKSITVANITIGGSVSPIVGRAIIIHAAPDDGGQPTGNAGARIGQGVIGVARLE